MGNKKSTALEALEQLRQNNKDDSHLFDDELLDTIEKELIALDIIKSWLSNRIVCFDEDVIVIRLKKDYIYNLNDTLYYYVVSEEEKEQIKLLKEVLK